MEALGIAVVATESRLLRGLYGSVKGDDVDQDLMFPICGSAEPYYSHERRTVVSLQANASTKRRTIHNQVQSAHHDGVVGNNQFQL